VPQPPLEQAPLTRIVDRHQHAERLQHGRIVGAEVGAHPLLETCPRQPQPGPVHVISQPLGVTGKAVCVELELDPGHRRR